MRCDTASLGD